MTRESIGSLAVTAALVSALVLSPVVAWAVPFGTNLIVNGDAEGGAGSASGFDVIAAPGWTTAGNATVVRYDAPGGFPLSTDPGPASRGLNFLAGGPSNGSSSMSQLLDVSSSASSIDGGLTAFALEGFIGGFSSQRDNAVLTATFLDGSNGALGSASIGPVSNADRSNATGLLLRTTNGIVPVGTRGIEFDLTFTRVDGDYNDGYADNLSLILRGPSTETSVPEPATLLLVASGLAVGGMIVRRRRR